MNTPNKITLTRILMLPLIVFFYLATFIPYGRLVAAILFVVACLTDFLDGYLARKNNQVTTLGKFFDSIADKMLIATGLILITAVPVVYHSWIVRIVCTIIILAREFIVSALRQLAASKGIVLAADMGGKIKATAQFIVVSLYMFVAFIATTFNTDAVNKVLSVIGFVLMILLIATTFLTVYSGASYLIRNRKVFKDEKIQEEINNIEEVEEISNLDPLFEVSLKSVIESGEVSAAKLQRELSIGYPRAARIVDQMEEAGYISAVDNTVKKRKVLLTMEEYNKIFKK